MKAQITKYLGIDSVITDCLPKAMPRAKNLVGSNL